MTTFPSKGLISELTHILSVNHCIGHCPYKQGCISQGNFHHFHHIFIIRTPLKLAIEICFFLDILLYIGHVITGPNQVQEEWINKAHS